MTVVTAVGGSEQFATGRMRHWLTLTLSTVSFRFQVHVDLRSAGQGHIRRGHGGRSDAGGSSAKLDPTQGTGESNRLFSAVNVPERTVASTL